MKTTDFSILGHNFTHARSLSYDSDYICKICEVRILLSNNKEIYLIFEFIDNNKPGKTQYDEEYKLTCNEQQIKNLLE